MVLGKPFRIQTSCTESLLSSLLPGLQEPLNILQSDLQQPEASLGYQVHSAWYDTPTSPTSGSGWIRRLPLSGTSGICVSITFESVAHKWGIISVLSFGLEILGTQTIEKGKNKQISDILVFYCCCNKLPQTQQLKTTHIYYFKSNTGLTELKSKYWPGLSLFMVALREHLFPDFVWLLDAAYSLQLMISLLHLQTQQKLVECFSHCLTPTLSSASMF